MTLDPQLPFQDLLDNTLPIRLRTPCSLSGTWMRNRRRLEASFLEEEHDRGYRIEQLLHVQDIGGSVVQSSETIAAPFGESTAFKSGGYRRM